MECKSNYMWKMWVKAGKWAKGMCPICDWDSIESLLKTKRAKLDRIYLLLKFKPTYLPLDWKMKSQYENNLKR